MKMASYAIFVTALLLFTAARADAIIFTNLHTFSPLFVNTSAIGSTNSGFSPRAKLLLSGNTLYGTTAWGGSNSCGTIFVVNNQESVAPGENTAITNLHVFNGNDGAFPQSDLVLSGNTLFGTAIQGGCHGYGTVFALNMDGTGFTNLFNFAFTNGANPQGGLTLSGNALYGTTVNGGAYGAGTIFSINTDGTGFTNLFNFGYTNGANPESDLLLLGNTLYGTTINGGGSNGWGTIFAINTDGTGFTNLFVFTNWPGGANPQGNLTSIGNVLCGIASGTVFLIATNGTGFRVAYNFPDIYTNADSPDSGLTVYSNGPSSYTLYGITQFGGQFVDGTVYALSAGGENLTISNLVILHNFDSTNGQYPIAGLVLSNGNLYGEAEFINSSVGGNVFSVTTNGVFTDLHNFQGSPVSINTNRDGAGPQAGLVLSGNTLYGTASEGGISGEGTIFAINTDGTGFMNLCNLSNLDAGPLASLALSGNTLYGTASPTFFGYATEPGAVFSINTDGTGFTNLCNFAGTEDSLPMGNLIVSDNVLYGVTAFGGDSFDDNGAVFSLNTDGTDFTNIFDFNGYDSDNAYSPFGGLVWAGNKLYGTTQTGGNDGGSGIVFSVNTDGTDFTNLFVFNGANGNEPIASLVLSGNRLYGVTESDMNRNCGTIFAINTDGSGFTNLYNFSGYDGETPLGSLTLSGNTLYGTCSAGGSGGYGTVFSINTDGTGFTTLYNFSDGNDGATPYDGLILSGNTLYGTTELGGSAQNGTVFALSLGPIPLNIQQDGTNVVLSWGNPGFSLQTASAIAGPYTTVTGATSPYTNTVSASQQFFRLQSQ